MKCEIIESKVDNTAKIYQNARITHSILKEHTVVGNYSRVDNSNLFQYSRVDRNNHLFHASLGRHTYTGMNTVIMHANIASFCSISWNVSIGGPNHDYSRTVQHAFLYNKWDNLRPEGEAIVYDRFEGPVEIKSDVWIASGAVITRGVIIHEGAVIGANSVVTKDIPPYAIAVGSPAKIINYRFDKEMINLLLQLKWWDWSTDKIRKNYDLLSSKPSKEQIKNLLYSHS